MRFVFLATFDFVFLIFLFEFSCNKFDSLQFHRIWSSFDWVKPVGKCMNTHFLGFFRIHLPVRAWNFFCTKSYGLKVNATDALERVVSHPHQFHWIWISIDWVKAVGAPRAQPRILWGFFRIHLPVRACNFFATGSYGLKLSATDASEHGLSRPHQFHLIWTSIDWVKVVDAPRGTTRTYQIFEFFRIYLPVRTCNFFSTGSYRLKLSATDAPEHGLSRLHQFHLIWISFDWVKAVGAPRAQPRNLWGFFRIHLRDRTCNFFSTGSYRLKLSATDASEHGLSRPHQFHLIWTSFDWVKVVGAPRVG